MKISPVATGGNAGIDLGSVSTSSVTPEKLAAAKAAFNGEQSVPVSITESDTYVDPQVQRIKNNIRSLKMKTNASPERYLTQAEDAGLVEKPQDGVISDTSGQVNATTEDTKPLSPQFAALARQKRALQVKERELDDRERALSSSQPKIGSDDLVARLKSQPLSVLQEHGVTYDQLTEAILSSQNQNPEIQQLRDEIKALKEGVDKSFSTQQESQEEAALTQMLDEAETLAKDGDTYEMIRERNAYDKVLRTIYDHYKKTGQVLDTKVVMDKIEGQLLNESLKLASYGKVKSKLLESTQPQTLQQQQEPRSGMRTLTNRDTAKPTLDRKARAMAAFFGNKK